MIVRVGAVLILVFQISARVVFRVKYTHILSGSSVEFQSTFSNSLIHAAKTKEITTAKVVSNIDNNYNKIW